MAWTELASYAIRWNGTTKKGAVHLWLVGRQPSTTPHVVLKDLEATEFASMAVILRSDPDHKTAFDEQTRELAGGVDWP
jgi:hypothetical protein